MKPVENVAFAYSASVIKTKIVQLNLHRTFDERVLLSSNLAFPDGTVYFTTTAELLVSFLVNKISLQVLFDQNFCGVVEIVHENKTAHFFPGETAVILSGGNRTFKEILEWTF